MDYRVIVLRAAGHPGGNLYVEVHKEKITGWSCGDIEDGIGMRFENERGGWVVNAQDVLNLAKVIRLELDARP